MNTSTIEAICVVIGLIVTLSGGGRKLYKQGQAQAEREKAIRATIRRNALADGFEKCIVEMQTDGNLTFTEMQHYRTRVAEIREEPVQDG